jgi:hypothetical protein
MAKVKDAAAQTEQVNAIENTQSENTTTAISIGNVDISDNTQVGELLTQAMTSGSLSSWEIESSNFLSWEKDQLYVMFVDGIEEATDKNDGTKTFDAVSFRLLQNGMPVQQFLNADIVFVSTIKKNMEEGKVPGIYSVYWNGSEKKPDPKRTGYKVLDIRRKPNA